METVRERKMVRIIVGVVRLIFYYLDLHQESWRLRPVEGLFSFNRERGLIFYQIEELAGLLNLSVCEWHLFSGSQLDIFFKLHTPLMINSGFIEIIIRGAM